MGPPHRWHTDPYLVTRDRNAYRLVAQRTLSPLAAPRSLYHLVTVSHADPLSEPHGIRYAGRRRGVWDYLERPDAGRARLRSRRPYHPQSRGRAGNALLLSFC